MDTVRMYWRDFDEGIRAKSLLGRLGHPEGVNKEEKELVSPDGIYRKITKYTLRGQHLYVMENPRFRKLPPVAVSYHATKFKTYSVLEDWLAELFAGELDFLDDAVISRIDLCVDLGISFDTAFQSVTRRGSRKVMQFTSSKGKSVYLGSQPSQTMFYEKSVHVDQIDWWADDKRPRTKSGQITALRLENRFFSNKCPIRSLKEVATLRSLKPFIKLEAKKIDLATMAGVQVRSRRRVESFIYRVQLYGYDVAKKEENGSGKRNFAKLVSRHVVNLNLDLEAAWQNRCNRFFGAQIQQSEVSNASQP
jgi:hypothetical protein